MGRSAWLAGLAVGLAFGCSSAPSGTTTDTDTVALSSGHSATWPNEPAGMRMITNRAFDAKDESGWKDQPSSDFSIVQDADAPKSPVLVGQSLFPKGFGAGLEPITLTRDLGSEYQTIYVCFWLKFSPNWYGQPANNGIVHIFIGDRDRVILYGLGGGTGPMAPHVMLRRASAADGGLGDQDLPPTLDSQVKLAPGKWQRWELLLTVNTAGNEDGKMDWWIDGDHAGSYDNLAIVAANESHAWQTLQWAPSWGETGESVPADQYMRMDHIYISGGSAAAEVPPPSADEPVFVAGRNTSLYYEDFESYSNSNSFLGKGWSSANSGLLSAPAGSGYGGGRAAQMQWPAGMKDMGMDRGVDRTGEGRVANFTFMYRTSAGFKVDNVGKKFAIMNLGDPDRVTTGLSGLGGAGAWDFNISGLFNGTQDIFAQPNVQAFSPQSVGEYLTNGNWHRLAIRRTRSSSGHNADGSIEIWVDGVKTHNLTGLMLGTQPILNIEFSGTWNNGSPQTQSEFYDNVRIWY